MRMSTPSCSPYCLTARRCTQWRSSSTMPPDTMPSSVDLQSLSMSMGGYSLTGFAGRLKVNVNDTRKPPSTVSVRSACSCDAALTASRHGLRAFDASRIPYCVRIFEPCGAGFPLTLYTMAYMLGLVHPALDACLCFECCLHFLTSTRIAFSVA